LVVRRPLRAVVPEQLTCSLGAFASPIAARSLAGPGTVQLLARLTLDPWSRPVYVPSPPAGKATFNLGMNEAPEILRRF